MIKGYEINLNAEETKKLKNDKNRLRELLLEKAEEFKESVSEEGVEACLFFVFKKENNIQGGICSKKHNVIALMRLEEELKLTL